MSFAPFAGSLSPETQPESEAIIVTRFTTVCLLLTAGIACSDQSGPRVHETVAASLVADQESTCALTASGSAYCWGADFVGELGIGAGEAPQLQPVPVAGGHQFRAISGAGFFMCAATPEGQPWCWGERAAYTTFRDSVPTSISATPALTSIVAGPYHACGITTSGKVFCWGDNHYGQLGAGDTATHANPVEVTGGLTFASVTVGSDHTCGLTTQGTAYCWGQGLLGALGGGLETPQPTFSPTAVSGGLRFKSLSAGSNYSCGVTTDGKGYCWGLNVFGDLGQGSIVESVVATPTVVAGGLTFSQIATSGTIVGYPNTCGLTTSGAAYCWGINQKGQLGDPSANPGGCDTSPGGPGPCASTPVAIPGGLSFATITVGGRHVCGATTGGAIYCWGANNLGQLGNGTTGDSPHPTAVLGITAP